MQVRVVPALTCLTLHARYASTSDSADVSTITEGIIQAGASGFRVKYDMSKWDLRQRT